MFLVVGWGCGLPRVVASPPLPFPSRTSKAKASPASLRNWAGIFPVFLLASSITSASSIFSQGKKRGI